MTINEELNNKIEELEKRFERLTENFFDLKINETRRVKDKVMEVLEEERKKRRAVQEKQQKEEKRKATFLANRDTHLKEYREYKNFINR